MNNDLYRQCREASKEEDVFDAGTKADSVNPEGLPASTEAPKEPKATDLPGMELLGHFVKETDENDYERANAEFGPYGFNYNIQNATYSSPTGTDIWLLEDGVIVGHADVFDRRHWFAVKANPSEAESMKVRLSAMADSVEALLDNENRIINDWARISGLKESKETVRCRYCGKPSEDGSGVCDACYKKYETDESRNEDIAEIEKIEKIILDYEKTLRYKTTWSSNAYGDGRMYRHDPSILSNAYNLAVAIVKHKEKQNAVKESLSVYKDSSDKGDFYTVYKDDKYVGSYLTTAEVKKEYPEFNEEEVIDGVKEGSEKQKAEAVGDSGAV